MEEDIKSRAGSEWSGRGKIEQKPNPNLKNPKLSLPLDLVETSTRPFELKSYYYKVL